VGTRVRVECDLLYLTYLFGGLLKGVFTFLSQLDIMPNVRRHKGRLGTHKIII
jgi:hypothetical protein